MNHLPPERFYKRLSSVTPRNKPIPPLSQRRNKTNKSHTCKSLLLQFEKGQVHNEKPEPLSNLDRFIVGSIVLLLVILVALGSITFFPIANNFTSISNRTSHIHF